MPHAPHDKPLISIVLACRNEASSIRPVLESIFSQKGIPGTFEVLLVDGSSTDGTREVAAIFGKGIAPTSGAGTSPLPVLRIIDNPAQIVSMGLNAGIRAASGEIVLRMDAHTEYAQNYVFQCIRALEQTKADNVGGPARTKADNYVGRAIAAAYHSAFSVGGARFHDVNYEGPVDTVTYGCWRKDVFDRFGYFDEELVRNQDDEHNLRIIRSGGKIWQSPKIESWYHPRNSLPALFKQYMQYGYWKVRVIQKHRLPASWRHLVPGALLLALILGLVLLPIWRPAFMALVIMVILYTSAVVAAALQTAFKSEWKLFPILPFVFCCYHFGYGYGFLRGIWDFVIRRRRGGQRFQLLTR